MVNINSKTFDTRLGFLNTFTP